MEKAGKRKFILRKIIYKDKLHILTLDHPVIFKINKRQYSFTLTKNGVCELNIQDAEDEILSFAPDKEYEYTLKNGKSVSVTKMTDIEMDGFYNIENIKFPIFNQDEISVIYNYLDKNDDSSDTDSNIIKEEEIIESNKNMTKNNGNKKLDKFKYAIIEIKLSKNNIFEMIGQLRKDQEVMETLYCERILYLGFVGSEDIDFDISENVKGLNLILYGIKNKVFYERDITGFLDWNLIYKVDSLSEKIDNINTRISDLEKKIGSLDEKVIDIQGSLALISNTILKKKKPKNNLRQRKRRRKRTKNKKKYRKGQQFIEKENNSE